MDGVNLSKEENVLSDEIFKRLKNVELIDCYEAYELLDQKWKDISIDLEMIQTEGFKTTKVVDPNMVTKKKNGKDVEVQEGWIGRIIPFDLVQREMLSDELKELEKENVSLSDAIACYEEIFENLSEEEKDGEYVNEDNTAFVWAEAKKVVKKDEIEQELRNKLKAAIKANDSEKALKRSIKVKEEKLHIKTKEVIESLDDSEVMELLHKKWIVPLVDEIEALPDKMLDNFIKALQNLQSKYETTFEEIEEEIFSTEKELSNMITNLTGNEFDMKGLDELRKMLGGE